MRNLLSFNTFASYPDTQKGVGLVEVLVSLLLLAVAALGYAALQGQAIGSTDESLTRTHAISLIRSTAEKMRINGLGVSYVIAKAQDPNANPADPAPDPDIYEALDFYQKLFNQEDIPEKVDKCSEKGEGCTLVEITQNDVHEIRSDAKQLGIKMGMDVCPGTGGQEETKCIIAAWNFTKPTKGSNDADCMSEDGAYHLQADCVYMEAY